MPTTSSFRMLILVTMLALAGCDLFTDAATRLAYDLKAGANTLEKEGDRYSVHHLTPSRRGECEGPYRVQLDRVGALVIWCRDDAGNTLASPGTSYHRRYVDTPVTYILD